MKDNNAMDDIQEKWNEIIKLFRTNYDLKNTTLKTKLGHDDIPILVLTNRHKRSETTNFIITYKGIKIDSKGRKGSDALVKFIKLVGVDDVYNLRITAKRSHLLISDTDKGNKSNSPKYIDGKVIFTKSENTEKITQIREIIDRLHLDASIDIEQP